MDGVTGIPGASAADIATNGTSMVATSVLRGTQNLMADEVARLFASFGIGTNIDATA
ncbi:MAG TPA: hypothetical protein VMA36_13840 [Candidatus Limnocylindria bacterium]|jgi:hypothetical protein|nr:hypothetical protein [Candidatus Limnocylindria bacterium]